MPSDPFSDIVSDQYERWVYPEPIVDLPLWLLNNWQWFDPCHAQALFWPARDAREDLDILIAGCGTNQAAVIAYNNPKARILAVDISQSSLNHTQFLKEKYDLHNLEWIRHPIETLPKLKRSFDLIISTGVLHHLDNPDKGLKALARCLRPDGVIALMLYARFGRVGVEMMQAIFREMGLKQDVVSLNVVKAVLAGLPADHPIRSYQKVAPDLNFDAGLVDTFLHGRDRSYTIDDCHDLADSAGLVFQDLFLKSPYDVGLSGIPALKTGLAGLTRRQQWSIMERINVRNGCHFFMLCHPDRDPSTYAIDFDSDRAMTYVPAYRYRCGLDDEGLYRNNWRVPLEPLQSALIRQVDGQRSIAEILKETRRTTSLASFPQEQAKHYVMEFFKSLWEGDFIACKIHKKT